MNFKSLANISLEEIVNAFIEAFADYSVHFTEQEIYSMLKRRGFHPELSFAAFKRKRIIGFTLNGVGDYLGKLSAYDTGTAILPQYRGLGLARQIFLDSMPVLQQNGIQQYVLEVMTKNSTALGVYKTLGFKRRRTFNCMMNQHPENMTHIDDDICHIKPCSEEELLTHTDFEDCAPSWQNDNSSILRAGEELTAFAAMVEDRVIGYCILNPITGDLARLAVDPGFRRHGIGTRLLQEAHKINQSDIIKCLNIETDCDSLNLFLKEKNFSLICQQYEMTLSL